MKKIFIVLLLLYSLWISAQEKTIGFESEEVTIALKKIEKTYHIKFSYPSQLLKDKKISLSKKKTHFG